MEKQEQEEIEKQEHVQEREEMRNQVEKQQKLQEPEEREREREQEQEKNQIEKQQKVQEPEEREREPEKKQPKVQEPKERGREREREQEQRREEYPNPPPKSISPSREMEVQHAKPSSPPKLSPPTPLPRPNSKPKSPTLDSPPSEVEDDYKKPPVKDTNTTPPPTAAACTVETVTSKVGITSPEFNNQERVCGGNTGGGTTYLRSNTLSILKRSRRDSMVKRSLLASRICGFVFSLVSFSVLAADRDRGWALDAFYRYKEFRYCVAVNVIAFVYSGFQGYDIAYQLTSGKRKVRHPLRYYLDFCVDQMLTYLLISASSSAAVRIDDWESNWGKDEFPQMARASVALSFLAFVAFALSSLISGYTVFTLKSM